jgi:hypothetical protein
MLTRYHDRRRELRVPARGPAHWHTSDGQGFCEVLDLAPSGAGLRMAPGRALPTDTDIALDIELAPGETWRLAERARVVRRVLDDDGSWILGISFDPQTW